MGSLVGLPLPLILAVLDTSKCSPLSLIYLCSRALVITLRKRGYRCQNVISQRAASIQRCSCACRGAVLASVAPWFGAKSEDPTDMRSHAPTAAIAAAAAASENGWIKTSRRRGTRRCSRAPDCIDDLVVAADEAEITDTLGLDSWPPLARRRFLRAWRQLKDESQGNAAPAAAAPAAALAVPPAVEAPAAPPPPVAPAVAPVEPVARQSPPAPPVGPRRRPPLAARACCRRPSRRPCAGHSSGRRGAGRAAGHGTGRGGARAAAGHCGTGRGARADIPARGGAGGHEQGALEAAAAAGLHGRRPVSPRSPARCTGGETGSNCPATGTSCTRPFRSTCWTPTTSTSSRPSRRRPRRRRQQRRSRRRRRPCKRRLARRRRRRRPAGRPSAESSNRRRQGAAAS